MQRKSMLVPCVVLALAAVTAGAAAEYELPLDAEAAQRIALTDADVEEADAKRLSARMEREDGEDVCEVEFHTDDAEYEYLIRNSDGMILEWSIEGRDVWDAVAECSLDGVRDESESGQEEPEGSKGRVTVDGTELVGFEQAKETALADVGADAEDAEFTAVKFEYDGRYYDYEVEFRVGRSEYEYTVDAQTGEIVKSEID